MGPVAQSFHGAFGLGASECHIGTVDADGVALAAIQGVYKLVQQKDARSLPSSARWRICAQARTGRSQTYA